MITAFKNNTYRARGSQTMGWDEHYLKLQSNICALFYPSLLLVLACTFHLLDRQGLIDRTRA